MFSARYIINSLIDQTPATAWLKGDKREQVVTGIESCPDYGLVSVGFLFGISEDPEYKIKNSDLLLGFCNTIAQNAPLGVNPETITFFSGSSQKRAEEFVNENADYNLIHTTVPGALMELYGLFDDNMPFTREQRYEPWNILSRRLANKVKGNATAILDIPKATSTFVTQEMPAFLSNKNVLTINGEPKEIFWNELPLLGVSVHELPAMKAQILAV